MLLAGSYWYVWRPLPKTSGRVPAAVEKAVTISRDAIGVVHIEAAGLEDAVFAQGYAMAQDRLWQMDIVRRRAAGELAEILGPGKPVELDQETRGFRFRRLAESLEKRLSDSDRSVLAAFARGVNFFLESHRGRLPLEFTLLSYDPRPWSVRDSLLVVYLMFRDLNRMYRSEVVKQSMLASGNRDKVDTLFPVRTGLDMQPGSNAWVISGAHTASGKPIVANDPHLEFSLPSIWYMVHLKCPGLHVTGVTLPGIPLVVLGHNEHIAWGVTNLEADVQDLYLEKLDPQTGRYAFQDRLLPAVLEREPIAVRGSKPVDFAVWVTGHGPVVLAEENRSYALRWTVSEFDSLPLLQLNQARDWEQFRAALSRWHGPAQNFVYADTSGNIGFQVAGVVPLRQNHDGALPADGAQGRQEWDGYIPFDDLPRLYNPPAGIIVTANQNPFPPDYKHNVGGVFAAPYRARQIRARLERRKNWSPADMLPVQTDVYSAFSHHLARAVAAAYRRRKATNPTLNDVVAMFEKWNGQMSHDLAAPMAISLVYQHLRKTIAERAAPGKGLVYAHQSSTAVVELLLQSRPKDWFPDWDHVLLRCLADAVEEGQRMQGSDPGKWKLGNYSTLSLPHPLLSRIPYVGRYFEIGPYPMSGSSTTVKQMTGRLGPSLRSVFDTSNWDRSLSNIVVGQSGQILSPHYKDQWQAYNSGRSLPSQFWKVQVKSALVLEPRAR